VFADKAWAKEMLLKVETGRDERAKRNVSNLKNAGYYV